MKKIVFPFLGMLILVLSGCMDKGENITSFYNEPAIFSYSSTMQPMIETVYGKCLAPELASQPLYDGNLLWTNFEINYDNQAYSDIYTVSNLQYKQIYSAYARPVPVNEMTDDYTTPIDAMYSDIKALNKMLFFWFMQKAPSEQTYRYEILYDPNDESEIPTLYIRSQKSNTSTGSDIELTTCYGFDMTPIVSKYRNPDTKVVKFNIKYYTGVGEDGKDVYKERADNPIPWTVAD